MKPVSSPRYETEKLVHFNSPSSSSNSCEKHGNMRRVEHFSLTPESNRSRYVYCLAPNFKRCPDDKYKVAIQNNLSTEEVHNNRKSVNGLCQPETGAIICSSRFSPFLANQCNSEVIDPGVTEQVVNLISRLAENSPAMKREQVHLRRCCVESSTSDCYSTSETDDRIWISDSEGQWPIFKGVRAFIQSNNNIIK